MFWYFYFDFTFNHSVMKPIEKIEYRQLWEGYMKQYLEVPEPMKFQLIVENIVKRLCESHNELIDVVNEMRKEMDKRYEEYSKLVNILASKGIIEVEADNYISKQDNE